MVRRRTRVQSAQGGEELSSPQTRIGAERHTRRLSAFPELKLLLRQRIEEIVGNDDFALEPTWTALLPGLTGDKLRDRLASAGDRDLLPSLDSRQQSGELGLRLTDIHNDHGRTDLH